MTNITKEEAIAKIAELTKIVEADEEFTTSVTEEQFLAYEEVRLSQVTNMFDITTVCNLAYLEKETVLEIMEKYEQLMNLYLGGEEL